MAGLLSKSSRINLLTALVRAVFGAILGLWLALLITIAAPSMAVAQVTAPPNINGGFPVGTNNLAGTAFNSQVTGTLPGLGLNQGETFTFVGSVSGAANWNSGLSFLNANILQVQARNNALAANVASYTMNFSGDVYGLRFTMGGLDFGDQTTVQFFHHGVQVPVNVSTYVNGVVTVANPNNIITFAGTNIDITPSAGGFIADGDGNNDAGGIGIHGLQEGFTVSLPLNVPVDQVVFTPTGKNNGSGGNVTLIYNNFAWATPDIALTKSSSFSQGGNGESNVGDIITYTYIVENNGNVPLTNVTLAETTFTGTGTTPVPTFSSGTGGATPANLPQGETLTYTASYAATAADLLASSVDNQATVTALPVGGLLGTDEITDLSDSLNAGDGGVAGSPDEDDPTTTTFPAPIVFNPSLNVVKTANTSGLSSPVTAGDTIAYTILVTNDGDVDVSGITLSDTLTNGDSTILSPPAPVFQSSTSGSAEGSLVVGETATYTFSYAISQADVDSELLSNTATASGTPFSGGTVSDVSDDNDDGDGNTTDDPTDTPLPGAPSLQVQKVASDTTDVAAGQVITYTYRVTNNGNQTITSVFLSDAHGGSGPAPIPDDEVLDTDNGTLGDSTDSTASDGIWDSLAPGDVVRFTANYTVTQNDVDTLQ